MKAARNLIALALELAARMKGRENQLQRGFLELRMGIDRDPSTVVGDGRTPVVLVERDLDARCVAVDGFVDGVVEDLPQQMMVAMGVGAPDVHRGPLANRLQAFENVDVFGGIRH